MYLISSALSTPARLKLLSPTLVKDSCIHGMHCEHELQSEESSDNNGRRS